VWEDTIKYTGSSRAMFTGVSGPHDSAQDMTEIMDCFLNKESVGQIVTETSCYAQQHKIFEGKRV
jgi:hypothetical protein